MKAIVLAAGKGTRMRPLTETMPKPLVPVAGKPILEHIITRLPEVVDELIVIVGYKGEMIQKYFGDNFLGRKITYITQEKQEGTYKALELARPHLTPGERFYVLYADDLHGAEGIRRCLEHPRSALVAEVDDPRPFGVIEHDEKGNIVNIVEKPENPKTNIVSAAVFVLDSSIFDYPPERHPNGEYYIPDAVRKMIPTHPVSVVKASYWKMMSCPADVEDAERMFVTENLHEKLA